MYKEFYFSGNSMPAVVAIKMCGVDFSDDNYLNSSTRCIIYFFFCSSTAHINRNGPNQKYFL